MQRTLNIFVAIFLILLLCFSAVIFISLQTWLYKFFIDDLENPYDLTRDEIYDEYKATISYCLNPFVDELEYEKLPMSDQGRIHFAEVRAIFQIILFSFLGMLFILPFIIYFYYQTRDFKSLRIGGISLLATPLVGGLLVFTNFDRAFTKFHELFFANDYWLFDPQTDPIIYYLPAHFFLFMAALILGLVFVFGLILTTVYSQIRKKSKLGTKFD